MDHHPNRTRAGRRHANAHVDRFGPDYTTAYLLARSKGSDPDAYLAAAEEHNADGNGDASDHLPVEDADGRVDSPLAARTE